MRSKVTRIDDHLVVVLDTKLAEELGLADGAEVDVSLEGASFVVTPARDEKLKKALDEMDEQYASVFRRLAE